MGVASGCGCKKVLLISIPLVSLLFGRIIPTFCSLYKNVFVL